MNENFNRGRKRCKSDGMSTAAAQTDGQCDKGLGEPEGASTGWTDWAHTHASPVLLSPLRLEMCVPESGGRAERRRIQAQCFHSADTVCGVMSSAGVGQLRLIDSRVKTAIKSGDFGALQSA